MVAQVHLELLQFSGRNLPKFIHILNSLLLPLLLIHIKKQKHPTVFLFVQILMSLNLEDLKIVLPKMKEQERYY